jgi:phospho-N-acetylmuramoyl-pentapeptide-transferase
MANWVYGAALAAAFAAAAVLGIFIVPYLRKLKLGQHILEIGPNWHKSKEGTPVMGGLIFILAAAAVTAVTVLLLPDKSAGAVLCVFFLALTHGVIGFLDDCEKILKKQNIGLSARQKLVLQFAVGIVFLLLLTWLGLFDGEIAVPFTKSVLHLGKLWYLTYPVALIMVVGTVNAVNLTDGVDGLASGVTVPVALFFALAADRAGMAEVGVFAAALAGALIGFLIYNFNPARVFMGDTGSLFLGGAVIGMAFVVRQPLVFILVGLVYYAEAFSVMLQVFYFKVTHGKRIFKMAPLHHHFELCGWSEKTLFVVFSGITLLLGGVCALWIFGIL